MYGPGNLWLTRPLQRGVSRRKPSQPMTRAVRACGVCTWEVLTAKLLRVLLSFVSDFVPNGLRAYPDVVNDPKSVTSVRDGARGNEHSRWVVPARNGRSADPAEPRLPICAWLLPRCDVLFALNPAELIVQNDNNGYAIASRGPATDRAVAHENAGEVRVDLKFDRSAIAFASGHPIFLCATKAD